MIAMKLLELGDPLQRAIETPYWEKVLGEARSRLKRGERPFTDGQIKTADDWQTCVCGVQDPRIPRDGDGEPQDDILRHFGTAFSEHVTNVNDDFEEKDLIAAAYGIELAANDIAFIEHRARQVLIDTTSG